VTGLLFTPDGKRLLITTNDSRIRLYDMDDYSMIAKFKGLLNDELQIKAYFSGDLLYIISGSENQNVYVWSTAAERDQKNAKSVQRIKTECYEYFKVASTNTVTCAQFLPRITIALGLDTSDLANVTQMIVSSGYNGELRFYENRIPPSAAKTSH